MAELTPELAKKLIQKQDEELKRLQSSKIPTASDINKAVAAADKLKSTLKSEKD